MRAAAWDAQPTAVEQYKQGRGIYDPDTSYTFGEVVIYGSDTGEPYVDELDVEKNIDVVKKKKSVAPFVLLAVGALYLMSRV